VLCPDKTGTLTQNILTLGDPFKSDWISADVLILCGALASHAEDKDTIDLARLAVFVRKLGALDPRSWVKSLGASVVTEVNGSRADGLFGYEARAYARTPNPSPSASTPHGAKGCAGR
jgi:hypothetical protein